MRSLPHETTHAEKLLDFGRMMMRFHRRGGTREAFFKEMLSRSGHLPDVETLQLAERFAEEVPDVVKFRAIVEDWDTRRISVAVLKNRIDFFNARTRHAQE